MLQWEPTHDSGWFSSLMTAGERRRPPLTRIVLPLFRRYDGASVPSSESTSAGNAIEKCPPWRLRGRRLPVRRGDEPCGRVIETAFAALPMPPAADDPSDFAARACPWPVPLKMIAVSAASWAEAPVIGEAASPIAETATRNKKRWFVLIKRKSLPQRPGMECRTSAMTGPLRRC